MKLSKLMLSAFVAAVALVSCNKEETTPIENRLKTVEISLENMMMTKSESASIADQTKVQVNKFKIFLTDDSKQNVYVGKDADGNDDEEKFQLASAMLAYINASSIGMSDGMDFVEDCLNADECRRIFEMIFVLMNQKQHYDMMLGNH